jgi:hypothetical protein
MNLDQIFDIANTTALIGWLVLLASPFVPRWADRIGGYAIPFLLSGGYATLVIISLVGAGSEGFEGGFGSLDAVAALFAQREAVLVGWIHFLAFDLFIGGWEVRTARAEKIPFLLVVPCLVFTFLLGPVGLVLFLILRAVMGRRGGREAVA